MARTRFAPRPQIATRWRMNQTYRGARRGYGSFAGRPFARQYRWGYARQRVKRGYAFRYAGRGFAFRQARRGFRVAARRDAVIRNYVGPRSAYAPVSTPAAGGTQVGSASYYGGRNRTASGGFVGSATCAHRSLPFGTRVLVTNLANSRQAVLTVNDRGPFIRGRIVDVSVGAAGTLGMLHSGTAPVRVQVVGGS